MIITVLMEEVQKVLRLGYNLVKIEHRGYVLPNIYNSKNNWQYITDRPVWNFGKDSHFWLGYAASDVKNKQPLDIKEIAEESTKKPALKKLVKQYYGLKGNRFFIYNRQGKLIKKLTLKKEKIFKVKGHRIVKDQYMYQIGKNQYTQNLSYRWVIKK